MEQIGKIIEVYIPSEDVMTSKEIGFKVQLEDEIIDIVEKQDEFNSMIHREDEVLVRKTSIDDMEFIDIELLED